MAVAFREAVFAFPLIEGPIKFALCTLSAIAYNFQIFINRGCWLFKRILELKCFAPE